MRAQMEVPLKSKKGQVGGLSSNILQLGVAAIILVLVIVIAQELRDTQTAGTEAYLAANKTVAGLGTFGDFWVIIVLAIVAAIVIGIIFGVFGGAGKKR
jgi:hypothetical protein